MPSMIENVFIFGVILPAVITVAVFVIFLICWFKCDLRQKLQNKFPFCLKKTQTSNSTASAASPKGIHYIQENLDYSSSTGHDRNSVGEPMSNQQGQAIPMHDTGHLANMGFEIGEDFSYYSGRTYSASDRIYKVDQSPAGPSSTHSSPSSYGNRRDKPISSSSPIEKRSPHKSSKDNVTVHLDGETDTISDNTRITVSNISVNIPNHMTSVKTVLTSPTLSTTHINEFPSQGHDNHLNVANVSQQGDSVNKWGMSAGAVQTLSSNVTPGVHKPILPKNSHEQPLKMTGNSRGEKRLGYVQQVFQFPHSSKHHKALAKMPRNVTAASLDNSSSSYSSSNDGDFFDREGDYGQFYPVSQSRDAQTGEVIYTPGNTSSQIFKQHPQIRHEQPLNISPTHYQAGHVKKAVYYPHQNTEIHNKSHLVESYRGEGTDEPLNHYSEKQNTHGYTSSSSQYSSQNYGRSPGLSTIDGKVQFVSQDV